VYIGLVIISTTLECMQQCKIKFRTRDRIGLRGDFDMFILYKIIKEPLVPSVNDCRKYSKNVKFWKCLTSSNIDNVTMINNKIL